MNEYVALGGTITCNGRQRGTRGEKQPVPVITLFITNPKWTVLGHKPGLCGDKSPRLWHLQTQHLVINPIPIARCARSSGTKNGIAGSESSYDNGSTLFLCWFALSQMCFAACINIETIGYRTIWAPNNQVYIFDQNLKKKLQSIASSAYFPQNKN